MTKLSLMHTLDVADLTDNVRLFGYDPNEALPINRSKAVLVSTLRSVVNGYAIIAGEVGVTNITYPVGHVKRYGAVGDGLTDDTTAIQNAVTSCMASLASSVVFFPAGSFKYSVNLVVSVTDTTPRGLSFIGVPGLTFLKPTAAVTIALTLATQTNSDGTTNTLTVGGLYIDGVSTTNATGILVGENAGNLSARISLIDVQVMRFTGATGRGMNIKNAVSCRYERVYLGRSTVNLVVGNASSPGFPTMQAFKDCEFREATTKGIDIQAGYKITFKGGVVESNVQEGVYSFPVGGVNVLYSGFEDVWFENNNAGAANFQVNADGTNAGTLMLHLKNCFFSQGNKSIQFVKVINFDLDNNYPANLAGSVYIKGVNNQGSISNWPQNNVDIATRLTNESPNTTDLWGPGTRGKLTVDPVTGSIQVLSGNPNMGSATGKMGKSYFKAVATDYAQPAYAALVLIDAVVNFQQINVTNGVAFTVDNPTNASLSMFMTIQIRNTSGGALGAVTWSGLYKLQAAWVSPATGFNRMITFVYDAGNTRWYEVSRSTADIAN